MATQNSTITVKGKLGNIVGYKGRGGKRLARIRQTEVKNPKTDGQIIQRMILATASKAYALMKSICDHSWQGVSYGGESQSYFLKKAMERIRSYVAESLSIFPERVSDAFKWVGLARPDRFAEAGFGLQISEGTIPSVSASYRTEGEGEDEDTVFDHFGAIMEGKDNTQNLPTALDVLNSIGAKAGDQITVVAITRKGEFLESRYVTESAATEQQLNGSNWPSLSVVTIEEGDVYDAPKCLLSDIRLTNEGTKLVAKSVSGTDIDAAAVIISRKVNGVWQRSTQYLMPVRDVSSPNAIIKIWQLDTPEIKTENPYYLNNADL